MRILLLPILCLLSVPIAGQAPEPVPDAAVGTSRQDVTARRTGDDLLRGLGVVKGQQQLYELARHGDAPTRYALLQEAVAMAERAGAPEQACFAVDVLARHFAVDASAMLREVLLRQAQVAPAAAAVAALHRAEAAALQDDDAVLARLCEVVVRAAERSKDPFLLRAMQAQVQRLREVHDGYRRWNRGNTEAKRQRFLELFTALYLHPEFLVDLRAAEFAPEFDTPLGDEVARTTLGDLGAARVLGLCAHARSRAVQRSLRLLVRELLAQRRVGTDEAAAWIEELEAVTRLLATQPGITRLDLGDVAQASQWLKRGTWVQIGGVLQNQGDGVLSHRYAMSRIRSVVLAGDLRAAPGGFELAVGPTCVTFRWQAAAAEGDVAVSPVWHRDGGEPTATQVVTLPTANGQVVPLHVALHQTAHGVAVCVDGQLVRMLEGSLGGVVRLAVANGSTVALRELLVDGELAAVAMPGSVR